MSDAFVSLDRDWVYTYVNQRAGLLFGHAPEELVGKHIWSVFPEGLGQPFQLTYERAMQSGVEEQFEDYYEPWDRWFLNIVVPTSEGLSIFFHDVTVRKQAQLQLAESEKQLRSLADNLPNGMVYQMVREFDGRLHFVYVSAASTELNGISPESLIADPLQLNAQLHPEDAPRLAAAEAESLLSMTDFSFEARLYRADEQLRWMRFTSTPRMLPDGRVLWDGIQLDITEQKRAEQTLQAQLDELNRWHRLLLDRIDREIALKQEVNALLDQLGRPKRYVDPDA